MTREKFILGSTKLDRQVPDFKGMTIADILLLPEELQPLAAWMIRQQAEISLAQVTAYLDQDEDTARSYLDYLVQQGFIQELQIDGEPHYLTRLDRRRASQVPEVIWQSLAPGSPLAIIRNPSGEQSVVAGESFELYVTVSNQGSQSAVIDVYIDESSQPLYQWCTVPRDRLALGPLQSGEVVFHIQVPPQALPSVYDYSLVVDAPEHYPEDTPIRHSQRVQVLPPVQEAVRVNDPSFTIQPATSSTKPIVLQPGQVLEVMVLVHNTSDRVDRFRLTCPDLDERWITVRYPEGLETPGLVLETDGLDLNPGGKGQIILLIHPPTDALAGTYSPTIRLHSANNTELMLLDLVYLQIQPIYYLNLELRTLLGKVKEGAGQFEIRLTNEGNTERTIALAAQSADEEDLFNYQLAPTHTWLLPPKSQAIVDLKVHPLKWWKRPLFGGGRLINFLIRVDDTQQLPLATDRLQGTLVWEARPIWQFLFFLLTTLGALGAIAFLIWASFFKPPAAPKILEFTSEDGTYQEASGDFIRLNWQVHNATQIKALRLVSQTGAGTAASQPVVYPFDQGIPKELQPFCGKVLQPVLVCKGVQTDARKAGSYVFELAVIPATGEGEPSDIKKTAPIGIQPQAPTIVAFQINGKDAASKYLVPISREEPVKKVILSWQVAGGSDTQVELLPAPGSVDRKGSTSYQLTQTPKAETFTLKATNAAGQQVSKSVTIETFDPTRPAPVRSPGVPTVPGSTLPPLPPPITLPVIPMPGPSLPPPPLPGGTAGQPGQPGSTAPGATAPAKQAPTPNPTAPAPTDPDRLSPSELPPQFD